MRLVEKALALTTGAVLIPALVVFLVPDGNDYALATIDKHNRLAAVSSPKVVFVGGSNLAFGLDSERIEKELRRSVVNCGMSAYVGLDFLLEEVKPYLRSSDVAVLSLEYELFDAGFLEGGAVDGSSIEQLALIKARPRSIQFLRGWRSRLNLAKALPEAARRKVVRVVSEAIFGAAGEDLFIRQIESYAGFNKYGDLESHLGQKWPYRFWEGNDLSPDRVNWRAIDLLQSFGGEMRRRGVRVVLLYSPITAGYYRREREAIEKLHLVLTQQRAVEGITPPRSYVFPDSLFFDGQNHLTREGRELRTNRVIADLKTVLGG